MKIFVSYSRHDGARVSTLQADLADLGHEVWFDRELTGGQAWWDEILNQVRACELFLFALSPRSLESPACDREWRYAAALGKSVLPVLIDGDISVALLPPPLAALQYIDYREQSKSAALRLSRAIDKLGPSGPLPHPLPEPPQVPLSYLGGLRETIHATQALSFPEQSALVLKLRHALREGHEHTDIHDLIREFLARDDVLARVAEELNGLLADLHDAPATPVATMAAPVSTATPDPAPDTAPLSEPTSKPTPRPPANPIPKPGSTPRPAPAPTPSVADAAAVPTPPGAPPEAQRVPWTSRKSVWAAGAMVLVVLVSMCSEETSTVPSLEPTPASPTAPTASPEPAAPAPARGLPSEQKRQITQDIDQLLKGAK